MTPATNTDDLILLEAVDHERNIARRYAIARSVDLFGHSIIQCSWGRIGRRGQSRTISFSAADDAARYVRSILRRRESAPARIGVAYRRLV